MKSNQIIKTVPIQKYNAVPTLMLDLLFTGKFIVLPCIDRWKCIDITTRAFSVPPIMVRG